VPPDKLYPMDIEPAFKKLDQIKPHIKVWWTQGNQSQQLIRDGEIDMMSIWNARASELAA
jgi:putative spermidine/putrescine transport system substrate-binding protein